MGFDNYYQSYNVLIECPFCHNKDAEYQIISTCFRIRCNSCRKTSAVISRYPAQIFGYARDYLDNE